jgi:hypothetical protein
MNEKLNCSNKPITITKIIIFPTTYIAGIFITIDDNISSSVEKKTGGKIIFTAGLVWDKDRGCW